MPVNLRRIICHFVLGPACLIAGSLSVEAQITSWTGQPGQTDFENPAYWSNGLPDENTIAVLGGSVEAENSSAIFSQSHHLGGLLISDGMRLSNSGHELTVEDVNAGGLVITGSNILENQSLRRSGLNLSGNNDNSTDLWVRGDMSILGGGELRLFNSGLARFIGSDLTIDSESLVSGSGTLFLGTNAIDHNGLMRATNGDVLRFFGAASDLDGSQGSGSFQALDGGQILLNAELTDAFDGNMEVGSNSRIDLIDFGQNKQFGSADIRFSGASEDSRGVLSMVGDYEIPTLDTRLHASGHGMIEGQTVNGVKTILAGRPTIQVDQNSSLVFGESSDDLVMSIGGGQWNVDANGLLDFRDTLSFASSTAVSLDGGTIKGEGSKVFVNSHHTGIRGHGKFSLPVQNDTLIAADGGTLFVDMDSNLSDIDGINDTGQWHVTSGSLHLRTPSGEMKGNVLVGGGNELYVEDAAIDYSGNLVLSGGTLRADQLQQFTGSMDVTGSSVLDSIAAFQQGVEVDLQQNLRLQGASTLITNAEFSGEGDLIVDEVATLLLAGVDDGIAVDLINFGETRLIDGNTRIAGSLENHSTLVFSVLGDQANQYTQLDVSETLLAKDATFEVELGYDPSAGHEFDLVDFGFFDQQGYQLELPELQDGLTWDTSDFATVGVLRISSVPEPSAQMILIGSFGLFLLVRRKRN